MRFPLHIKQTCNTDSRDEIKAIQELAQKIDLANTAIIFLFVNSEYHLDRLAQAMAQLGDVPIMACTTAGSIHEGHFQNGGISAIALPSEHFYATVTTFEDLNELAPSTIHQRTQKALSNVSDYIESSKRIHWSKFCVQLIDGISGCEEKFTEDLSRSLSYIPFIGGSAGDQLNFEKSYVYSHGRFINNASTVAFCATSLQVKPFCHQHFESTEQYLIVTRSDTDNRCVHTFNGLPASEEYARQIGINVDELTPQIFSLYPLIVEVEGEIYIRSIQRANDDGSLTFYCSISRGIILKVAKAKDLVMALKQKTHEIGNEMGPIGFILGFNCILRYLEIAEKNQTAEVEEIHSAINLTGFNSYGEQFQSTHINQTLTGIAFGEVFNK